MSHQGKDLLDMSGRMFKKKDNWDQFSQEVAYWFDPAKANFTDEIYTGEDFADHIVDPVPLLMARDLGDAFGTMMRSDDWFKIALDDPDLMDLQPVREKLDYMTDVTMKMLYDRRGSFTKMAKSHEHDFSIFGGGVSSINLNKQFDGFQFHNWHLKDTAFSENDDSHVDRLSRKIKSSARNITLQFEGKPHTTIPSHIASAKKNNHDQEFDIFHMAVPVDIYAPQTRDFPKEATHVSVYLSDNGDIIQEQPEYQFPYIVSRWRTVDNWGAYPFSPAIMAALPHARMLQSAMATFIDAGEKAVNPPLLATTESISSPIDISAGAVTWLDAEYDERMGRGLEPMDLGKNIPLNERMLDSFHQLMGEAMYISKLNIPGTSSETAYEVSQLIQQNIRQLQPIFEPAQDEIIYPYLNWVVSTGLRLGAYGPPESFPEEMRGQDVSYTFFNPLQQERDRRLVAQAQEAAQIAAGIAEIDPSVLADAEPIQWFRDAMRGTGAPANWLKAEEEGDALRAQRAQAEQQQQQIEQAGQVAEIARTGGEAAQAIEGAVNPS